MLADRSLPAVGSAIFLIDDSGSGSVTSNLNKNMFSTFWQKDLLLPDEENVMVEFCIKCTDLVRL